MLRILSGFLLLIISQFSFSQISTTQTTVPATSTTGVGLIYAGHVLEGTCSSNFQSACAAGGGTFNSSTGFCHYTVGAESFNYSYGQGCSFYSCPSGTLSGTNCIVDSSVDSCTAYQGQSGYFWVSKVNVPQTICSGTCLATVGSYSNFPDADPESWQGEYYTYTGQTSGCTSDTGFTDEATAAAANAAAAERERLKKIADAIAAAKSACGGEGHYTTGTFNGNTVVTCKDTGVQTSTTGDVTTTTVTNADGSTTTTTTTTTNNTSTTNNNSSTTINSDGSTSTSGGSSGSTSGTTTSVVTRAPDGTVIASSTSGASTTSGAVGTCSSDDMADTAGCAELGEAGSGDSDALEESPFDWGFTEQSAFGGSSDASCPSSVVIMPGVEFEYDGICEFLRGIRPFMIAVAYIVAAMIALGLRTNSGGD